MYKFKTEKYKELLNGKTVEWLAKEICYSNVTLYSIFNGHKNCKKVLAIAILKVLNNENEISEYFDEIKGE